MKRIFWVRLAVLTAIVSVGVADLSVSNAQAGDAASAASAGAAPPAVKAAATEDAPCGSIDHPWGDPGCPDKPPSAPGKPRVLFNDDWVIKPRTKQTQMFKLAESHRVRIQVVGVKDTAKGFKVVTTPDEGGTGGISQSYRRDFDMAAGPHVIAVTNSENALKKMTVHVSVVQDPGN